jgi:hypothetical protein
MRSPLDNPATPYAADKCDCKGNIRARDMQIYSRFYHFHQPVIPAKAGIFHNPYYIDCQHITPSQKLIYINSIKIFANSLAQST